jgi:hypothetical protein
MSFSTLGRASSRSQPVTAPQSRPPGGAPDASARGPLNILDRVFLGIPNEREPGALAIVVFMARQYAFTAATVLCVLIGWLSSGGPAAGAKAADGLGLTRAFAFAPLIIFEELGRYAFVRRAERPLRALIVFTAPIVAICALFDLNDLYGLAWEAGSSVLASAVLYWGLRYRGHLPYVVAALMAAHMAIFMAAPNADPTRGKPPAPTNLAPVAPAAGDMRSWAKLYPGGAIATSRTSTLLGLTDWDVNYEVQASPEEIDAFYRQVAHADGFAEEPVFAGLRSFKRDGDEDEFSYMAWRRASGSTVVSFKARTSGKPPPGA